MDARPVCLITPPSPFLLDERGFPFLGPLKVAAVLEQAGIPVEVIDLAGYKNYLDIVCVHAHSSGARSFGVSATTPQFPAAVEIARVIKEARPDARTILGGTHATLTVAALKNERTRGQAGRAHRAWQRIEENFDVVVSGDGERAVFKALEPNAPKLIDTDNRLDAGFLKTGDRELERVYPARHLIDLASYRYFIDGAKATSLIAQLGCPYKCGFCAGRASPMLRNIRTRSAESIVEEMLHIHAAYGLDALMFYDDELNVSSEMVDLMQAIAKAGRDKKIEWKLRGFIKSERFNEAQAAAMHEAGFRQILIGFESGSPRILENIQKIATQADNTRCMDIARRHNLKVKALMSFGHPGESAQTVEDTHKWLVEVEPSDFDVTIITPYPGSPYYDGALPLAEADSPVWVYACRSGDKLYQQEVDYAREADYYKGDPNDGYVSHVWTDFLSGEDLIHMRDETERGVREGLGIPFNPSRASELYEHSMGQTRLPDRILRTSAARLARSA